MATKDEEARKLAEAHYNVETGITAIYRVTGSAQDEARSDEPIKFLEVNEHTIPAGIMPLSFGPSPASGIHFSSVIIEVTPEEFESIQRDELKLPHGWTFESLFARPSGVGN